MDGAGLEMSRKKENWVKKRKIYRQNNNARFMNLCFTPFCSECRNNSTVFDAGDRNDRIRTIQTNTANH